MLTTLSLPYGRLAFLGLFLFIISCSSEEPGPALQGVIDIVVSDNGNVGDGSDVEVNFTKQFDLSNIGSYRVLVIKASNATGFGISQANDLPSNRYTSANPADVFPVQGVSLTSSSTDTDGDLINDDTDYVIGVVTVTNDEALGSSSLALDNKEFRLTSNNLITDYTILFEGGAGSIVMADDGSLYMGGYNIVDHVAGNTDATSSIFRILLGGTIAELETPLSLLSGSAIDSEGTIYLSQLFGGNVTKFEKNGMLSTVKIGEVPLRKPDGIHVGPNDDLYVVDSEFGNVVRITQEGESVNFANAGANARGITGDEAGNLYVSHNNEKGAVSKITPDGKVSVLANIPTFKPESYVLDYVMWVGYITYHEGFLYVAGMSTDKIYKVSLDGQVEIFAGSGKRGIPRGDTKTANLNRPIGLVFSPDGGSMFVSISGDTNPTHTQSTNPARIIEINIVE